MKKLKKRTRKGMTLAEIIVSLAVLSVLTLILVTVSSTINAYLRSASNVNNKVNRQAPAAEVGYIYAARAIDDDVTITVEYASSKVQLKGKAYSVENATNIKHIGDANYRSGDALDMKFIEFQQVTTEAASPGAST